MPEKKNGIFFSCYKKIISGFDFLKNKIFKFKRFLSPENKERRLRRGLSCFFIFLPFLILIIYYSLAFLLISKSDVCLAELKRSFEEDLICREACALNRLENKKCLISVLKNNKKLEKKLSQIFLDESLNLEFRKELINIFASIYSYERAPDFLSNYFSEEGGDKNLKLSILRSFKEVEEIRGQTSLIDYYFSVFKDNLDPSIQQEALVKISAYPEKFVAFTSEQINFIREQIFLENQDSRLRQSLVLLLSDYHKFFPEEVEFLWRDILVANFYQDNISRAFAADFLDENPPEVSQAEWNNYYKR